jgi:DNA-binding NarL/FixJ family response regulator
VSNSLSILVAEGNPYLRDQWVILLDGYRGLRVVGTTDNGQQVVGLCTQFHPQVVLMDTEMPVTNGFTAGLMIRRQFPDIRLVLLNKGRSQDKQLAREIGAHAMLLKPVTLDRIVEVIYQVCRHDYYAAGGA